MRKTIAQAGVLLGLSLAATLAIAQSGARPAAIVPGGGVSSSTGMALRGHIGAGPAGCAASTQCAVSDGLLAPLVPVFTVTPQSGAPVAGTAIVVAATVQSGTGATLGLFYRQGGETAWVGPVVMTTNDQLHFSGTIPGATVGVRGIEYHVRATQNGITSTRPATNVDLDPFTVQVTVANAGIALPDAAYRLFSFPFIVSPATVAEVFQDDLGASDTTQWRLGRWDETLHAGAGGYRSFADVGNIARGRGYWVIARGGKLVDGSGLSALPDTIVGAIRYARLDLPPGWSQIGTPFAFALDWTGRIEEMAGDIEDTAWSYAGGPTSYVSASVLQPYAGFWVRNASSPPAARRLLLPYAEALPAAAIARPNRRFNHENWQVRLILQGGGREDQMTTVGVAADAHDMYDARDASRPPDPWGPSLSIVSLGKYANGATAALVRDIRAAGARGQRFALLVRGEIEGACSLRLTDDSVLPAGYMTTLMDVADGRSFVVSSTASLTLPRSVTVEGTRYDLLIGDRAWVVAQGGEPIRLPTQVALAQNYPNPFNPRTTIVFDLPTPGHARLAIFDAAGRRLAVLLDRELIAGQHVLVWNGRDDLGRSVASGRYYCRLEAEGATRARTMTLIR